MQFSNPPGKCQNSRRGSAGEYGGLDHPVEVERHQLIWQAFDAPELGSTARAQRRVAFDAKQGELFIAGGKLLQESCQRSEQGRWRGLISPGITRVKAHPEPWAYIKISWS
jgi:hypothetical protein